MKLSHIGWAVSHPKEVRTFLGVIGFHVESQEEVSSQQVMTHFVPLRSEKACIELLEPRPSGAGAVGKFLSKRGPGIHHLAFEIENGQLTPICEKLKSAGYRLIYDQLQPGAHGTLVQFVHPSSVGGVLVELVELP